MDCLNLINIIYNQLYFNVATDSDTEEVPEYSDNATASRSTEEVSKSSDSSMACNFTELSIQESMDFIKKQIDCAKFHNYPGYVRMFFKKEEDRVIAEKLLDLFIEILNAKDSDKLKTMLELYRQKITMNEDENMKQIKKLNGTVVFYLNEDEVNLQSELYEIIKDDDGIIKGYDNADKQKIKNNDVFISKKLDENLIEKTLNENINEDNLKGILYLLTDIKSLDIFISKELYEFKPISQNVIDKSTINQ
ncbi:hypothetical protein A0H76_2036 [Hepatospora eriocheir]|uniref:Uncharacterized protein n=1 Tax=Hepatospora eriocheir TaxID=1081669 RepID=A0A1X0QKA4_9MICR|nr:hypothetical protein A0H76_2036 [Hepatospora eriocheir]